MQLSDAADEEKIDQLLDKPSYSFILNNCGWSITEPVVPSNRFRFLQHLVYDEVITKRENNLKAFFRGLNSLQVGDLIKAHPDLTKSLFVVKSSQLTYEKFLSFVSSPRPQDPSRARAFDFFSEFVIYLEGE